MKLLFPKRKVEGVVLIGAVLFGVVAPAARSQQFSIRRLPVERYTLPNGLTVLLSRDTTVQVVAVDTWFHVGSKNEVRGRTGFAHLFEHLMFQGSKHVSNGQHFKMIESAGGVLNASTANDVTNYYQAIPANQLETALWLESDRMGFLLDSLTKHKLDVQRDVVKNERRQRIDNQPFGTANELIAAALYPASNPYSWPVIGSMADLTAATLDDVVRFFHTYYAPGNATLAIVGNFDPAKVKALVLKYYGPIPPGPQVTRPTVTPATLNAEKRIVLEDARASLPRLNITWPTTGSDHMADDKALDALSQVLTHDRTSRLTRTLVYDRKLVTFVSARQLSYENEGQFQISVQPHAGVSLSLIKQIIDSTLRALATTEPATVAEVNRFKNSMRVQYVFNLDGSLNKAEQLLEGQVLFGNPLSYVEQMDHWLGVTTGDVQRVLNRYFATGRVVTSMVPKGSLALAVDSGKNSTIVTTRSETPDSSRPPSATAVSDRSAVTSVGGTTPETFDRLMPPVPGPDPRPSLPAIEMRRLSNGVTVAVLEDHRLPAITLSAILDVPAWADPPGKTGLTQVTSALFAEGTTHRTAAQIADASADLGTQISPYGFFAVSGTQNAALDVMADELLNPIFPEASLKRLQTDMIASLRRRQDDPNAIASRVQNQAIYGPTHPYSRTATAAEILSITRDDVVRHFQSYYRPPNVTFVVAGDIKADTAVALLEKYFANWKPGTSARSVPPRAAPLPTTIYLYDRPGSQQSIISFGQPGPRNDTPEYYALDMVTTILGGAFSSRLNLNLREEHHFTYGARSDVMLRKLPEWGMYNGSTAVETPKTDSAVAELLRVHREIESNHPITETETDFARSRLTKVIPLRLETLAGRAGAVGTIISQGYPLDFYDRLAAGYARVTAAEAERVLLDNIDPEHLTVVIVGDRKLIEPGLRAMNIAPIVIVPPLPPM